ncbi:MurR/RpiR family transcriptional regulator [Sulfobacillus thermosulfidooxidans]|uniref:MurR/RpiR family transcriptional regulator n=1 Tax=Sulfobacillus thermosulfidooxidans TaxID=28034 RepID=UPI0006B485C9|nr:MurR/RpiR family transcriptional regulator [Sulfobacillus thermosulfidooxidans]
MKPLQSIEGFMDRIRLASSESITHQQIGDYLALHLREASFMSSGDLAKAVGVSQASITRFCHSMGFGGYSEFVHALQEFVREEWRAPERTVYLRPSIPDDADPLLAQEVANLESLPEILDSEPMNRLVNLVATKSRVILAGARISSTLIPYAAYCLGKIRNGVEVATPGTPLWDNCAGWDSEDTVIVGWVFPRYSRVLMEWLEAAHHDGVRVAALTDRWMSPVMTFADPVLVVPVATASLFDSYVAPMFVINYLVRQVAQELPGVRLRLEQLEERDQRLQVYWSRTSTKNKE